MPRDTSGLEQKVQNFFANSDLKTTSLDSELQELVYELYDKLHQFYEQSPETQEQFSQLVISSTSDSIKTLINLSNAKNQIVNDHIDLETQFNKLKNEFDKLDREQKHLETEYRTLLLASESNALNEFLKEEFENKEQRTREELENEYRSQITDLQNQLTDLKQKLIIIRQENQDLSDRYDLLLKAPQLPTSPTKLITKTSPTKSKTILGVPKMSTTEPNLLFFIPIYSGDQSVLSVKQHLANIENHAPLAKWNDDMKIQVAKARTSGQPNKILTYDPEFQKVTKWEEFRKLMIDRFHPYKTAADKALELVQCGQTLEEPVNLYINRFLLKLDKVYPKVTDPDEQKTLDKHNESHKVEHFINGLIPSLKSCLIIKKPADLKTAIALAREYGQQLTTIKQKPLPLTINLTNEEPSSSSQEIPDSTPMIQKLEEIQDTLKNLKLPDQPRTRPILQYPRSRSPSPSPSRSNDRRVSFNLNPRSRSPDSPFPRTSNNYDLRNQIRDLFSRLRRLESRPNSNNRTTRCYICQEYGHINRNCPRQNRMRTPQNSPVRSPLPIAWTQNDRQNNNFRHFSSQSADRFRKQ